MFAICIVVYCWLCFILYIVVALTVVPRGKETEDESVALGHRPTVRSTRETQPSRQGDSLCVLLELMERRDEARRREDREREDAGENEWKRGKSV